MDILDALAWLSQHPQCVLVLRDNHYEVLARRNVVPDPMNEGGASPERSITGPKRTFCGAVAEAAVEMIRWGCDDWEFYRPRRF